MFLFRCLYSVNDTSVSLSEGFLLLILPQTGISAGKSAETQEMQLTTEIHKKSEFFKAVRMHVVFSAKVLPPAHPREENSKPILRPAQPLYTPTPPQTRRGDTRTISSGICTSQAQTNDTDPQGNTRAEWDRPDSGSAVQPYILHEQ